ncbi:hypothetical protein FB451DRAFT_1401167 [Mycena latifolia]|nr:hypothetical protein FB451DRAFT_1401167 [Mycena latifolia]
MSDNDTEPPAAGDAPTNPLLINAQGQVVPTLDPPSPGHLRITERSEALARMRNEDNPRFRRSQRECFVASRAELERHPAPAPLTSRAATRVRRRQDRPRSPFRGSRESWDFRLTEEHLYLTIQRLPDQDVLPSEDHFLCAICKGLKSHPASPSCGHSFCYVCLRVWLERSWICPLCVAKIDCPPKRPYSEEHAITAHFPVWDDRSEVAYSWEGLRFPAPPAV